MKERTDASGPGDAPDADTDVGSGRRGDVLQLTVFISGAAVMAVEVLGTRVLAPMFGAGIYVWAALLSATLCALAAGYYGGGALADRWAKPTILGLALAAAGITLALAVLGAPVLLSSALAIGPRVGALVCAFALFGPSLMALGMVGPIAVRLATTDLRFTGHRVGYTYAISTLGSLVGTLAVVFVLIPRFEIAAILWGTAATLVLLGAGWLRGSARPVVAVVALLPGLAIHTGVGVKEMPGHLVLIDRVHSPYGLVEVVDDNDRGVRLMRADHSIIGGMSHRDGTGPFTYTHLLEALRFARPDAERMLQIGLGTGTLPTAMTKRGLVVDVVEIDPGVARLARTGFGYEPSGEVRIEDARAFINRAPRRYDLVVHDTFTGGVTPAHLLSREVLVAARRLLRPGGILALNLPGFSEGPHAAASEALARTMRSVFPFVRVFRDAPPTPDRPLTNLVFFASDRAFTFELPPDAHFESPVCARVLSRFTRWEVLKAVPQGPLVTDARNPLMRLQAPIAAAHHAAMGRLLPTAVWLPW